jgi:hypothetical protein
MGKNGFIDILDNTALQTTWTINGEITIDGNGNVFTIEEGGQLVVASGAHLILRNMSLELTGTNNIVCCDNSSKITLEAVHWIQDSDFAFMQGALIFKSDVKMSGQGYVFSYQSTQTSTIDVGSCLTIDFNFTFSYSPSDGSEYLLQFTDYSSQICLYSSILYIVP